MSIKQNAIDSIALGLEDYESSDEKRIISCTRNIYAGILLLFKHKISMIDEELLWDKKNIKRTIDYWQIKDIFESHSIWDKNDQRLKRVDKINDYRNKIEHRFSTLKHESVKGLISNSFIVIRDFISVVLEEDPKVFLGDKSWETLVAIDEVYQKEEKECKDSINSLIFSHEEIHEAFILHICEKCGSDLIFSNQKDIDAVDATFSCKSCGTEYDYKDIASDAMDYFVAIKIDDDADALEKLIKDAIESTSGADGWANLEAVENSLKNNSLFDEGDYYGYQTLSGLIKSFCDVEQRDSNTYVKFNVQNKSPR
jgi:DNA-directed RNA polymerase subunit M/transcription elongation factor TFIIS